MEWRKNVRYLSQWAVSLPGTPLQFIETLSTFSVNRAENMNVNNVIEEATTYLINFSIKEDRNIWEKLLNQEWTQLSGGKLK